MMDPMMMSCGAKVPLLLVAAAAGYGVLVVANKQVRPLDILGRILGGIVLFVSLAGLVCTAVCSIKCKMGTCSAGGAAMSCSKSAAPADAVSSTPAEVSPTK